MMGFSGRSSAGSRPRRRKAAIIAAFALVMSAVGAISAPSVVSAAATKAPSTSANSSTPDMPANPRTHLRPGVLPKSDGAAPRAFAAPAGAHLTYYGGKIIPNVKVVQVLYGAGTYTSEVSSTGASSIAALYRAILNSSYMSWLVEYNTASPAQTIGFGSFTGQFTITPSAANAPKAPGCSATNGVTDAQIQAELKAQVTAGHLPAADTNTYYVVHFPANVSISQGGSCSGVAGGFCAYHGTVAAGALSEFYYGVIPDFTTPGMTSGCGGSTRYGNETSVSSHELIEAITDPEVGIATVTGPPLAWYDTVNGEIGDICNAQQATIIGTDNASYVVQTEFSNAQNNCVVTGPSGPVNDFSMAVSPSSVSVTTGASGTATVSTALTKGVAQTVNLTVAGVPAGATASFSPTSVSSGASSTLTINSGTAAPGTYTLTVTGTGSAATHTAALSLTINPVASSGVTNGGFETGTLSGWVATGASTSVQNTGAHSGTYTARDGNTTATNGDSSIAQTFTATAGATGMSFFYKVVCPDTVTYDWALATLKDNTAGTTATVVAKTCTNTGAWSNATAAVVAGHSYTLTLTSHDDNYASDPTYVLYDDVTLTTSAPPPPAGITNGGFELGSLSGWTPAGAATSVVSTGAHSGTYAAQGGKTTATNGDSTISQTVTVPAGKTQLSLWYKITCPDTVTYDWATITLKNNTAGTTATMLGKTCATVGWTNLTAAVTAGSSYTITLTSHDDNYAADPTYSQFDDVVLN